jgi:hypothetical protein
VARYALSGGVYTFTPTEHGWELYRSPPQEQPSGVDVDSAVGAGSQAL